MIVCGTVQWRSNGVGRMGKVPGAPSAGAPESYSYATLNARLHDERGLALQTIV